MSKDPRYDGYCEPCREERGLDKGERRFSGKCNICGDSFTLLWRDTPDSLALAERRREMKRPFIEMSSHAFRIDPSISGDIDDIFEAHSLKAGDAFSYMGSFKVYEALTDAKLDPSYDGKVKLTVTHNKMGVRLDQYALCWIHNKTKAKKKQK